MKAMILAAGRGERMRPLTDKVPKPLLEVNGKPLIEYHIERLASAGIEQLVVNVAHLGQQIIDRLGDGDRFGLPIRYSRENPALETAGGIRKALPLLGDGAFLVVNADIFTDYPFEQLLADLPMAQAGELVLVDNPAHNPDGDFAIDPDGRLLPPGKNGDRPRHTFAGIALYQARLFEGLPEGHGALGPLLRDWASQGQLKARHYPGRWTDVGTPERLAALNRGD